MLLAFTFILLAIGIGILVSVYSVFFPFIKNLGEIGNFNTAYYGAISSIERAELVIKYHEPGFEGSGGYIGATNRGPISDARTGDFGFINYDNNGLWRTISSRTRSIPRPGFGNVEYLLAAEDSTNYNMLNYQYLEKIILSLDTTLSGSQYYTSTNNISYFDGLYFTGAIRLPPKIFSGFGGGDDAKLCDNQTDPDCNPDGDGIGDEMTVDRSLEGFKGGSYFKIIPNISVLYYSGMHVDPNKDIAIRKSLINNIGLLEFGQGNKQYSPISNSNLGRNTDSLSGHVVISSDPDIIERIPYSSILSTPSTYSGLEVNFGLITLLTANNKNIYPFLEYQFSFPQDIADKFYNIQGNGRVGEYEVKIKIQKPTNEGSVAGSFTVIF